MAASDAHPLPDTAIIGLDIGGTKTAVVVGDRAGRIHWREAFATRPERGLDNTLRQLFEAITAAVAAVPVPPAAISVSVGGPLDIERGVIQSPPNLPGWVNVPLKQLLTDRFGLPVHIEHDGNAGALAEFYFGAARGARHAVFLTLGTGLGAGIIIDGRVHRGVCDLAGEVGHVRLADDGPVAYGKAGSWESFCGGAGVIRLAALRNPDRWAGERVSVAALADLARAGDASAQALFNEVGRQLGRGLAMLIDILNPDVIVLGALGIRLSDLILGPAHQELAREALPAAVAACRIVPAALGERLGDVAALAAAIAALGGPRP